MAASPQRRAKTGGRLPVAKTYKLFIGGKFPRSESGRSIEVSSSKTAEPVANVAWGSRKDVRDAVRAARGAVAGWSAATAYNRGQVLYRVAEMLEGRFDQFVAELTAVGATPAAARSEVAAAIDTWVYYAGFSDKYQQVLGSVNPVAAPYFNFTLPEPTGVVALVAPDKPALRGLSQMLAPALVTGNATVLISGETNPLVSMSFAEVIATSDVPAGAVNIITGYRSELVEHLAQHMDVNALDLGGVPADERADYQRMATGNLKRVWSSEPTRELGGIAALERCLEMKTVWHPTGV